MSSYSIECASVRIKKNVLWSITASTMQWMYSTSYAVPGVKKSLFHSEGKTKRKRKIFSDSIAPQNCDLSCINEYMQLWIFKRVKIKHLNKQWGSLNCSRQAMSSNISLTTTEVKTLIYISIQKSVSCECFDCFPFTSDLKTHFCDDRVFISK